MVDGGGLAMASAKLKLTFRERRHNEMRQRQRRQGGKWKEAARYLNKYFADFGCCSLLFCVSVGVYVCVTTLCVNYAYVNEQLSL